MPTFTESAQTLSFEDSAWTVVKFDEAGGHYRTLLSNKISGTKAVDFVGLHSSTTSRTVFLLEVTNYARNVPELESRIADESLAEEFATKVRDTIAGIVLLHRIEKTSIEWAPFAAALTNRECRLRLVLWVCPCPIPHKRMMARVHTLNQTLKGMLRIPESRMIAVVNLQDAGMPDVTTSP